MSDYPVVKWGIIPLKNEPEFTPFDNQVKEKCNSCGKMAYLREDPVVFQLVCRPCWAAMMFGDDDD